MGESYSASVSAVAPPAGADGGAPGAGSSPSFLDSIPAEFREKSWAQDFAKNDNPFHAFAKSYEDSQTLIGKKSAGIEIPGDNATAEQLAAWHKALGVPEKPDYGYKLPDLSKESEPLQKYMQTARDENFTKAMQEVAHKVGVTPKQWAALTEALDGHSIAQAKLALEANMQAGSQRVEQQNKALADLWGDKHEGMKTTAKDVLAKVLPENVRNTKDPEIVLLALANYVHEREFKGDSVARPGAAPGATSQDIRSQIMTLIQKPEYSDWTKPGHAELKAQVQELYKIEQQMKSGS